MPRRWPRSGPHGILLISEHRFHNRLACRHLLPGVSTAMSTLMQEMGDRALAWASRSACSSI